MATTMSDEPNEPDHDEVRRANEREKDLDAETIVEDAEELFSKRSTERPLQPDAPPSDPE
jgi:hypothetical protein